MLKIIEIELSRFAYRSTADITLVNYFDSLHDLSRPDHPTER